MEADVDKCAARRAAVARVGALEADVAGACGLAMVYCMPGLRTAPEYAAFLTRLAGGAHRREQFVHAGRAPVCHALSGGSVGTARHARVWRAHCTAKCLLWHAEHRGI